MVALSTDKDEKDTAARRQRARAPVAVPERAFVVLDTKKGLSQGVIVDGFYASHVVYTDELGRCCSTAKKTQSRHLTSSLNVRVFLLHYLHLLVTQE